MQRDKPMVVTVGVRHQRIVGTLLQDFAVLEEHDLVGVGNGRQSMRDDDDQPVLRGFVQCLDQV